MSHCYLPSRLRDEWDMVLRAWCILFYGRAYSPLADMYGVGRVVAWALQPLLLPMLLSGVVNLAVTVSIYRDKKGSDNPPLEEQER